MGSTSNGEEIWADVGEVFGNGGDGDVLAGDAQPEAALGEVESEAEAKNEDDSRRPDKERATVFSNEENGSFGSVVEGNGPLFVESVGCFARVEAGDGFIGGGRSAGCADTDDEEGVGDLRKLQGGGVGEEDGEGERGTGDGDATGEVYLETPGGAGLVEDYGLGANEASGGVTDGEGNGGDEGGLVKNDAVVGEGVVHAQVVAVSDELTVAVDAEIGDIVGGEAGVAVKGGSEVVDAEADVVGGAALVNDGALAGREGLVKGETGEAIAEAHEGSGKDMAGGAVEWEAVPLGEDASHEESNEGGMKGKGGEGGPGVFVGVKVSDGFIAGGRAGADAVMAFAQFGSSEGDRIRVVTGDAFEGVQIKFVAAANDGMFEVLPDGRSAVEGADDDTESEDGENEKEVPAGEDGKELEGVEDGGERAVARQGVLLEPGGVAGGVVEDLAGGLDEIDAEQADKSDGGDEQDGCAHGTEPAPGGIDGMAEDIGDSLPEAMPGFVRVTFECPGTRTVGSDKARPSAAFVGACCHDAL